MRITDTMHKDYKGRYYRYVYVDGKYHIEYMNDAEVKAERRREWEIRNHHEPKIRTYARYESITTYGTDTADGIVNVSTTYIMDAYRDYKMSMEF